MRRLTASVFVCALLPLSLVTVTEASARSRAPVLAPECNISMSCEAPVAESPRVAAPVRKSWRRSRERAAQAPQVREALAYAPHTLRTTMLALIEALAPHNLPDLRVVQMLGGLGRVESETYGADLTLRMAQMLGAKARLMPSPGIVGSQMVRDALLQDANIAETLALAERADLAIVGIYKLSKKVAVSANWVFNTGDAATFPSGKYTIEGQQVPYYTERNGYRYPSYHRLDLGLTLEGKQRKTFESSWNFSVYNAYGRENAYVITFRQNEDNPQKTEAVQTALFKVIPSVTYNFKFR